MKPARIFQQYIWIVNALRKHKRLTLKELSDKWVDDEVADGNPMPRSSFNKYRDGIFDMFGLNATALTITLSAIPVRLTKTRRSSGCFQCLLLV